MLALPGKPLFERCRRESKWKPRKTRKFDFGSLFEKRWGRFQLFLTEGWSSALERPCVWLSFPSLFGFWDPNFPSRRVIDFGFCKIRPWTRSDLGIGCMVAVAVKISALYSEENHYWTVKSMNSMNKKWTSKVSQIKKRVIYVSSLYSAKQSDQHPVVSCSDAQPLWMPHKLGHRCSCLDMLLWLRWSLDMTRTPRKRSHGEKTAPVSPVS